MDDKQQPGKAMECAGWLSQPDKLLGRCPGWQALCWRVCRLPVPRPGQVLGLVGTNGIGKSTALKVLAGKLKPNLGRFEVGNLCQALT